MQACQPTHLLPHTRFHNIWLTVSQHSHAHARTDISTASWLTLLQRWGWQRAGWPRLPLNSATRNFHCRPWLYPSSSRPLPDVRGESRYKVPKNKKQNTDQNEISIHSRSKVPKNEMHNDVSKQNSDIAHHVINTHKTASTYVHMHKQVYRSGHVGLRQSRDSWHAPCSFLIRTSLLTS